MRRADKQRGDAALPSLHRSDVTWQAFRAACAAAAEACEELNLT